MEKEAKRAMNSREPLHGEPQRVADEYTEGLEELKMLQILVGGLVGLEAMRLQGKAEVEAAEVRALEAQAARCRELVQGIEVELERAGIRPPAVGEEDALIHGRVVGEDSRGLSGLAVAVSDEEWRPLKAVGTAITDANGYYALAIPQKVVKKLAENEEEVFLVILSRGKETLYESRRGLLLKPGAKYFLEKKVGAASVVGNSRVGDSPEASHETPFETDAGKHENPFPREGIATQPPPGIWIFKGCVVGAKGGPLAGVTVSLFDKDLVFDDRLGAAVTDEDGNFMITYAEQDFRDLLESNPDLYVTVRDQDGQQLYSSRKSVRFEAGREEVINIRIRRI